MKQIMVHGPNDVRLDDQPEREPGPRDALVRIAACGICGTDVSYVHMGGITGKPMPLGHEMAGVVEWVGDEVPDTAVGDRVIVYPSDDELGRMGSGAGEGGLTPLLLVREAARGRRLFGVPDGMPLQVAALAEPLGSGHAGGQPGGRGPGDKVVVFGCGPVGLMSVATLADRGIEDVVAVDLSQLGSSWPTDRRRTHAGPRRGGHLGGVGATPRHRAVHVRSHAGHGCLHRGVRW